MKGKEGGKSKYNKSPQTSGTMSGESQKSPNTNQYSRIKVKKQKKMLSKGKEGNVEKEENMIDSIPVITIKKEKPSWEEREEGMTTEERTRKRKKLKRNSDVLSSKRGERNERENSVNVNHEDNYPQAIYDEEDNGQDGFYIGQSIKRRRQELKEMGEVFYPPSLPSSFMAPMNMHPGMVVHPGMAGYVPNVGIPMGMPNMGMPNMGMPNMGLMPNFLPSGAIMPMHNTVIAMHGMAPNYFMGGQIDEGGYVRRKMHKMMEKERKAEPNPKYNTNKVPGDFVSWTHFFLDCQISQKNANQYSLKMRQDDFSLEDWVYLDESTLDHLPSDDRKRVLAKIHLFNSVNASRD